MTAFSTFSSKWMQIHYELMERIPTSFRAQTGFLVRELNTYFVAVPRHEQQSAEIRVYKELP